MTSARAEHESLKQLLSAPPGPPRIPSSPFSPLRLMRAVFLPEGYPHSTSSDYMCVSSSSSSASPARLYAPPPPQASPELLSRSYQLWDTAQAVCSSAVRVITTEALLKSLGVGDSSCVHRSPSAAASYHAQQFTVFRFLSCRATALGATLQCPTSPPPPPSRFLSPTTLCPLPPAFCTTVSRPPTRFVSRDLLGKFARVFFCAFKGSEFDRNPKRWRLVADVTNDLTACCDLVMRPALLQPSTPPLVPHSVQACH